jgi:hypothetical protein
MREISGTHKFARHTLPKIVDHLQRAKTHLLGLDSARDSKIS